MATKRARITDRDPLTATDGVLAGYEQVNKLASQLPEVAVNRQSVEKSTSKQVSKSTSQQPDDSITTSRQPDKSTSQEVELVESNNPHPALDKPGSQEVSKLESQQANKLTSQEVINLELTSQQANKSASEEVETVESDNRQVETDKLASQQVSKPTIRKATFQIDAAILEALDRYHLQLQIEMGRRNAPYKEILVEEAIAQWLERAAKSPDRAVKSLLKRQEQR
jgi:hypothetical protein